MLVLDVILLINFVVFLSVSVLAEVSIYSTFSIDPNFSCLDYGVECGQVEIYAQEDSSNLGFPDYSTKFSCNENYCGSGKACIYGKCVSETLLGECVETEYFKQCEDFSVGSTPYGYPLGSSARELCTSHKCSFNDETGKCSGTRSCSKYVEEFCLDRGCRFDARTNTCAVDKSIPSCWGSQIFSSNTLLNLGFERCFQGFYGCGISNSSAYTAKYLVNGEPYLGTLKVFLDKNELATLEEEGSVPVYFSIENLNIPEGMPISFSIYTLIRGGERIGEEGNVEEIGQAPHSTEVAIRTGENAVEGVIDGKRKVESVWYLTKEDLNKMNYKGQTDLLIFVKSNNLALESLGQAVYGPSENSAGGRMYISLETKRGECSGNPSCNDYSEIACRESQEDGICSWNSGTNSCEGDIARSCESFEEKGFCKFYSCSWTYYSFWERFIDWIKSLFGR